MEYSESLLTDLYLWCFSTPPDTITEGSATSADNTYVVTIYQREASIGSFVWCVGAQSESFDITAFEFDLAMCIDNFKQAWTNKAIPV